jgi:TetR/AcrR family transcriptional regulator, transcriptional repressor for nem operon
MKVTKEQAARNKASILDAAARLYREHGIDGVGIGQLARSVGLTHGGFYGQFPGGKDQLVAEAVARAFEPNLEVWNAADSLGEIVSGYLSDEHVEDLSNGCPIPSLGADVARSGELATAAFTRGVREMLAALEKHAGDLSDAHKHARSAQLLASAVGAILIARAVDDPELSKLMLQSVIDGAAQQAGRTD